MAKIGDKRDRIRIAREVRTQRDDGGFDVEETTVCTRWASVRPERGNEAQQAGRQRGAVGYVIEIDARADVRAEDTIYWVTNGNLGMNVREVRQPDRRTMDKTVIAETGVEL